MSNLARTAVGVAWGLLAVLAPSAESMLHAQQPPTDPEDRPAVSELDEELFESLGGDPLEDRSGEADAKNAPSKLDEELLRGLEAGEDAPLDDAEQDPFQRIDRRMRRVESLIAEAESGEPTQSLQREIVEQLDALIKQLRKNARRSQSNSPEQQQQQTAEREQVAQPSQAEQAQDGANQQARDSTTDVRNEAAEQAKLRESVEDMLRGVWGQLPERVREQMLQGASDRYLPKYELMIERYFKELADRPQSP